MSWLTMSNSELLDALDRKQISPSKIIGGGYKSSAIARKLAREYLLEQIAQEGECDKCNNAYELSDRTNRCGECGNCNKCCTHEREGK
jgi:hypothetical protein